jgi:hypothetical protein
MDEPQCQTLFLRAISSHQDGSLRDRQPVHKFDRSCGSRLDFTRDGEAVLDKRAVGVTFSLAICLSSAPLRSNAAVYAS